MAPFGGSNPGEADPADVQLWVTLLTKVLPSLPELLPMAVVRHVPPIHHFAVCLLSP